jgi:Fe-S-cluster containining protein
MLGIQLANESKENIEFLETRGFRVELIGGSLVAITHIMPCDYLEQGICADMPYRCSDYPNRPAVCRQFPYNEETAKAVGCPFYEET